MKDQKKIEYLISLFFNTGRLIKEQSCSINTGCPFMATNQVSMLKLEAIQLIENEEPTMKRIAEYLHIKAPSATSLVNGLVKSGYIKRISDPNDRRAVRMKTTDKGKIFLKDGFTQMTKKLKEVLSKLKDDQIENFINIMQAINNSYK
jgi:MarR family transcriptional regulator, organic hydroperoxide resistance regulator